MQVTRKYKTKSKRKTEKVNSASETCGTIWYCNKSVFEILEKQGRMGQRQDTDEEFFKVYERYQPRD